MIDLATLSLDAPGWCGAPAGGRRLADALRLPVTLRVGPQPIEPVRWPDTRSIEAGSTPGYWTCWRALLLAAQDVGRDVSLLKTLFPGVAAAELRVRSDSLRAGLQSRPDGRGAPAAGPSGWLEWADPSEKAAIGYRVGMAAAQLAAVEVLGLPTATHLSLLASTDQRRAGCLQADLYAQHPRHHPRPWLLEAKGGCSVTGTAGTEAPSSSTAPATSAGRRPTCRRSSAPASAPCCTLWSSSACRRDTWRQQ